MHWREGPALALVTFQGARVLDYRLVELSTGMNALELPMTAGLAPNFELAVAVMHDTRVQAKAGAAATAGVDPGGNLAGNRAVAGDQEEESSGVRAVRRFHTASSPFTVQRDLRVSLELKRKGNGKGPLLPGEEADLYVTTTDLQGHPVSAELSLALVEQSLLERFGWQVGAMEEFFRGSPRQTAVRTTSSITFSSHPATRPINPQLLAEADRLEVGARKRKVARRLRLCWKILPFWAGSPRGAGLPGRMRPRLPEPFRRARPQVRRRIAS